MHDPVRYPSQRQYRAGLERRGLGQTPEACGNPATVELRELARLRDQAARRHRQDRFAVCRMDAKRVSARSSMPPQPDRKDLRAMLDQKSRGFGGAPIEERASGHICKSGEEQFARILPYPPPGKSLGAKTNHLPNIQGLSCQETLL